MQASTRPRTWRRIVKLSAIGMLLGANTALLPAISCSVDWDDDHDRSLGDFLRDLGDDADQLTDAVVDFGRDLDRIF